MDRLAIAATDSDDSDDTNTPVVNRGGRLHWGLSVRLPRLCAFDGRRSQVAPGWVGGTAPEPPAPMPPAGKRNRSR